MAAERTGRCCRGDVILRRYQSETGKSAVLEATGEPFGELQEKRSPPCVNAGNTTVVASTETNVPAKDFAR
jgi:hypothetical protein